MVENELAEGVEGSSSLGVGGVVAEEVDEGNVGVEKEDEDD